MTGSKLAGNQPGACGEFPQGKKMCRGEETRLLLEFCVPHVGLGSNRTQEESGPPRGDTDSCQGLA